MSFKTDKQTQEDLNIFSKPGKDAVFNIYNQTHTSGGATILERLFLFPLDNADAINNRSLTIQFFSRVTLPFPIKAAALDSAEIYLAMTDPRTRLSAEQQNLTRKFSQMISADGDYKLIVQGIGAILEICTDLAVFLKEIGPIPQDLQAIEGLLKTIMSEGRPNAKLSYETAVRLDGVFRFTIRDTVKEILAYIYHLDVYMSIAQVATARKYVFPVALDKGDHTVTLRQVYHPLVKNATANDITITPEKNVLFLTGANMAGKSTLMKSMGIALYLAHMGLPVAAEGMEFSVRDGIYTTINLPDDLSSGISHFYAEVLRVKKVAKELGADKNLFIIFDELFRGTNVKDAYEGTIAITQAFAGRRNCMFVVSTHIIEAGDVLAKQCPNINFVYLPTRMEGNTPVYTYKLETGITADRHGMVIINNERILEIIRSRKSKTASV
ncbi:DNA mismatch repair protein [Chitinophaga sp. SYP-B3965]|uniref:MutS-related protein n=1 Tax=Chitinophaga sp. SYP-B3965 TaxID=2663120 RepID=UPI001299975C|nr:DNA mismatch repair protein [Chitinophaga sp. SYP-B3965]MRG44398.1 DNA mismatch repair protein [Chitinophaga sp. SYP-B3965]